MDARNNRRQDGRPSVVTANRLHDGHVVWLAGTPLAGAISWSETIEAAQLFGSDAIDAAIEQARQDERRQIVVDVYGVQVETAAGRPEPVTMRERVRAHGPSVRPLAGLPAAKGDTHGY